VVDEVFDRRADGQDIALAQFKDAGGGFRRGMLRPGGVRVFRRPRVKGAGNLYLDEYLSQSEEDDPYGDNN
jgi:hypothetical protein